MRTLKALPVMHDGMYIYISAVVKQQNGLLFICLIWVSDSYSILLMGRCQPAKNTDTEKRGRDEDVAWVAVLHF